MTKKIIAVDLDFPKQVEFYGPRPNDKHSTFPKRQKLRGKLRLVTSQPTRLSIIEVRFKGSSQLYWRDPLTHSLLANRMHAWKTIRKSKHILLQDGTIPTGVTDLGFEITIPGYVCPTYQADYMNVNYIISAKIIPVAKFAKDIEVEKTIDIRKTLMPKDIAYGMVTGYKVPRTSMHGKRNGCLSWEFKVPKWVCMGNDIEFEGVLKSLHDQLLVDMIQVDVVQEELYHDDGSDQGRRHLTICPNIPSTYLHPPLSCTIEFQFPLSIIDKGTLRSSVQDKNNTLVKRDVLNYSLDSPFLNVRHFIRIMIYTRYTNHHDNQDRKSPPICLGLPIYITERIDMSNELPDVLPSYRSVARDGERLPDYVTQSYDEDNEQQVNQDEDEDDDDEEEEEDQNRSNGCSLEFLVDTFGQSRHSRLPQRTGADKRGKNMVIQERRLDDFWLLK
ncbi:uncharacterized protein BX664DRAFT_381244 [Halteromyces radiatus]|uniref:uncharacterized protein n=1 Tax=Halteromyces radiatus TaxID=101107 RepID=UPI00221EF000|nr:uncharacterized protein BX664DRAFT_381244 [Halteromyces radiatus]KAI8098542.1 hypothetical protein BX664DRAFT_381244 [Halteromyces radiatus]